VRRFAHEDSNSAHPAFAGKLQQAAPLTPHYPPPTGPRVHHRTANRRTPSHTAGMLAPRSSAGPRATGPTAKQRERVKAEADVRIERIKFEADFGLTTTVAHLARDEGAQVQILPLRPHFSKQKPTTGPDMGNETHAIDGRKSRLLGESRKPLAATSGAPEPSPRPQG
jgi:hypothetical protein